MTDDDDARLRELAVALADGVEAALAPWVEQQVARVAEAWRPGLGVDLVRAAQEAGAAAAAEIAPQVRELLAADVDAQRTGPLALIRGAVPFATQVLADAGVPPVERDEFAVQAFPEDRYDLSPGSFADLDPSLQEAGLVWGAAKAHVVLARRRAEGLR